MSKENEYNPETDKLVGETGRIFVTIDSGLRMTWDEYKIYDAQPKMRKLIHPLPVVYQKLKEHFDLIQARMFWVTMTIATFLLFGLPMLWNLEYICFISAAICFLASKAVGVHAKMKRIEKDYEFDLI